MKSAPTQFASFDERCRTTPCRVCGHGPLKPVLDLGTMPVTATFRVDRNDESPAFPLEVAYCNGCSLVQLTETVASEVSFNAQYPYFSSYSDALLIHSREHVEALVAERQLDTSSHVVELASNDGYLLRNFVERGIPCLGIEPCEGPANAARALGVESIVEFFGESLAQRLVAGGKQADVIIANNVLAHVTDQNDFVRGIAVLLKDDGVARLEFPYVRELIDHCEFDTIYHEHLCYFSLHAVDALMRRHGLFVNDVELVPIHGGSLRISLEKVERPSTAFMRMMEDENLLGIHEHDYYADFGKRVADFRDRFRAMLLRLKDDEARIAAYGAAAKGVIMLNYLNLGAEVFDFIVDRSKQKHGLWLPGLDLQVEAPEILVERMPDYTVILPWNFKDEIIEQQREYRERGGRFIVPIPEPTII